MSNPTAESNAPVLNSGAESSATSDDPQMQVDLPEPADDLSVSAPVNSQQASDSGSTPTHDEQKTSEDAEPPRPRPRPRVRRVSPRSMSEIKSSYELVSVVYGAVHAHQQLYERAGILHGDINPNTILILDWPASGPASSSESSCASESESPCAFESESPSGAAAGSQSASQPGGSASASEPKSEKSASSSRHGADGEGGGDGEGEGEGHTEGALVDFDVPYSAAAWRHPRPGPYRWENHSRLRMRRYGFY